MILKRQDPNACGTTGSCNILISIIEFACRWREIFETYCTLEQKQKCIAWKSSFLLYVLYI